MSVNAAVATVVAAPSIVVKTVVGVVTVVDDFPVVVVNVAVTSVVVDTIVGVATCNGNSCRNE